MILGFDPGRDKCGVAVMGLDRQILYHQVVLSEVALDTVQSLCQQFLIKKLIIGDRTTAKQWQKKLQEKLPNSVSTIAIDEHNSTLEARDRYWQIYPPKGLQRLIPQGMRLPPRPIDDIVAIILIERYLQNL